MDNISMEKNKEQVLCCTKIKEFMKVSFNLFVGEWESDQRHGYGYEGFPNGCIYQGDFVNGKPEGIGRYTWPNG